jgi:hypothetical protein
MLSTRRTGPPQTCLCSAMQRGGGCRHAERGECVSQGRILCKSCTETNTSQATHAMRNHPAPKRHVHRRQAQHNTAPHRFCSRRANSCMKTSRRESWCPGGNNGSRPNLGGQMQASPRARTQTNESHAACTRLVAGRAAVCGGGVTTPPPHRDTTKRWDVQQRLGVQG